MDRKRMGVAREAGYAMKTTGRGQMDLSLWNLFYLLDPEGTGSSSFSTIVPTGHPRNSFWGGTGQSWRAPGGGALRRQDDLVGGLMGPSLTPGSQDLATAPPEAGSAIHTSRALSVLPRPETSQSGQYKISLLLTFYKKSCVLVGHGDETCRARTTLGSGLKLTAGAGHGGGGGKRTRCLLRG